MAEKNPAETYNDFKQSFKGGIKDRIFDIIAVGIVIAMLLLNLGAIELKEITWRSILDICIECLPFFLAAMLLNANFYTKGTFAGKKERKYIDTLQSYSTAANALTGDQLDRLSEFCAAYNDAALKTIQSGILQRAAVSFERFDAETYGSDKEVLPPLKALPKKELRMLLGKERTVYVLEAKAARVKGIDVNTLLSGNKNDDMTDLGRSESDMAKIRKGKSAISWWVSVFLMALMGVKDVATWGWLGIGIIVFKLGYIVGRSYMSYFDGYSDITTTVVSHYARKADVLKQFDAWYAKKLNEKRPTE
jgi:hypothetical protein